MTRRGMVTYHFITVAELPCGERPLRIIAYSFRHLAWKCDDGAESGTEFNTLSLTVTGMFALKFNVQAGEISN